MSRPNPPVVVIASKGTRLQKGVSGSRSITRSQQLLSPLLVSDWDNNGFFLALRPLQRRPRRLHRESRAPRLSSSSVFRWPTPTSTLAPLATRPSKEATDAVGGILNGASGAAGGLDISKIVGGVTGAAGGAGGPLGAVLGIVESLLNVILGLLGSLGGIAGGAENPLALSPESLEAELKTPLALSPESLEAPLESSEASPTPPPTPPAASRSVPKNRLIES
ncbi:hypothetical protein L596_015966 [Steinernema carpocapsae]|uniref:Uncharacterized protein n=1 Tax=Steinernema carpocapsae TaxID=34508 RepID=A0A4U5NGK4_STECR|nr:hypothetical protein L596_015966 [Steinernema carpocapsae]